MSSLAAIASRRSNRIFGKYQIRAFATPSVDLDHYSSGWNISDLGESGKYQIQTFNKISEKVRGIL
jgi:hypothetical protein